MFCWRYGAASLHPRAVAEAVLQILMEADVECLIGAGRRERSADRLNCRN
jgi:hypothetical protein